MSFVSLGPKEPWHCENIKQHVKLFGKVIYIKRSVSFHQYYIARIISLTWSKNCMSMYIWDTVIKLWYPLFQSIIYYTVRSPHLSSWLETDAILESIRITSEDNYVDVDPMFSHHIDEDYDSKLKGVSKTKFCSVYLKWIKHCYEKRDKVMFMDLISSMFFFSII